MSKGHGTASSQPFSYSDVERGVFLVCLFVKPTLDSLINESSKVEDKLSLMVQTELSLVKVEINPLSPELNPICYLLALLGVHHLLQVSRIRVKSLTFRRLMSYIYGAPILDVSRSHTTTQHSR